MNSTPPPHLSASSSSKPSARHRASFGWQSNSSLSLETRPVGIDVDPHTLNALRTTIKGLQLKLLTQQAEKKMASDRIRKLERENQQLHQEVLWRDAEIERLQGRLTADQEQWVAEKRWERWWKGLRGWVLRVGKGKGKKKRKEKKGDGVNRRGGAGGCIL